MNQIPRTTLEQWAALRVVIESGGFAQAAEVLHRSQSSVSYAVAQLQERLGLKLLQIEGRKAQLTDAGRALLAEAIPLIDDLTRLEERSRLLAAGHEASIRLLIDSIFPKPRLLDALAQFRKLYPHVRVDLRETVRQSAPDPLFEPFDLAITLWNPQSLFSERFLDIELVAVAHHDHPLHRRRTGKLTLATLSRHLLVAINQQGWDQAPTDTSLHSHQWWQVSTVEVAIDTVRRGLCYGWLPRHLIAGELASGQLLPLPLAIGAIRQIPLAITYGDQEQAGPATSAMVRLLLDS